MAGESAQNAKNVAVSAVKSATETFWVQTRLSGAPAPVYFLRYFHPITGRVKARRQAPIQKMETGVKS